MKVGGAYRGCGRVGGAIRGWWEGGRSHQGIVCRWKEPSGDGVRVGGAIRGWCEGGRSHQGWCEGWRSHQGMV